MFCDYPAKLTVCVKEAGLALQGATEAVNLESTGFIIAVKPSLEKKEALWGQQDQLGLRSASWWHWLTHASPQWNTGLRRVVA